MRGYRQSGGAQRGAWLAFAAVMLGLASASAQDPIQLQMDERRSGLGLLDAVQTALSRNASVQVAVTQVDTARGRLREFSGQFDTTGFSTAERSRRYTLLTQAQRLQFPPILDAPESIIDDQASAAIGLTRLFRNGLSLQSSASLSRVTDNISRLTADAEAQTRPEYALTLIIPLLKNSGIAVAAPETVARAEVEATQLDLAQAISQTVFDVTTAYWALVSAERALRIAGEAETSASQRVRDVRRLIEGDRLPASQIDLVEADLASKRANRIAVEQQIVDARSRLGRAMGLQTEETFALATTRDAYPEIAAEAVAGVTGRLPQLRDLALSLRRDLKSAAIRRREAEIALRATRKNLNPQFDVGLSAGYSGLREGDAASRFWDAYDSRLEGPNAGLSFSLELPFANNAAQGRVQQQLGALERATIQEEDLRNAILIGVAASASAVQRLAQQTLEARRAEALFAQAVANEEQRRQLGSGTLLDVISVSDRLLSARFNVDTASFNYAVAVAQLRLATGTLANAAGPSPGEVEIDRAALTTLPP